MRHISPTSSSKPDEFRLVFVAAATAHNVFLSAMLPAEPGVNVPLTRLPFRFRLGAVEVRADVCEMHLEVLVRKADQDVQPFVWRDEDGSANPTVYIINVITIGGTSSPASAQRSDEIELSFEASKADDSTRVMNQIVFDPQSRWQHGPEWLRGIEASWPVRSARTDPTEATMNS